jgi:hypothetical protein
MTAPDLAKDAVERAAGDVIWEALCDYRLTNMGDEDGEAYPLVDLLSNDPPATIESGREEACNIADAVFSALASAGLLAKPMGREVPAPDRTDMDSVGDEWHLTLIYDRLSDWKEAVEATRPDAILSRTGEAG